MKISVFDTTLRDGSQGAGIAFTVEDKIKIAKALDSFGISYIEGGWPGSNPKDELFFSQMKKLGSLRLKNAKLTAFSSTRRKGSKASEDKSLHAIAKSGVKTACIFGKSWDLHVKYALKTTNEENLKMIFDSVAFLKSKKLEVIFDAEHYFDGYRNNREYALETVRTAIDGGADIICLCETNGGMLPSDIQSIIRKTISFFPKAKFGIHAHNDSGCAVANSIAAVEEGCVMVQGTINGIGERCGNANLCSIIPALEFKRNYECISKKNVRKLSELSRYVDEIANLVPDDSSPYIGNNAFAHKAGIHVSAIERNPETYEHISPALVGNKRRILISDLSGKSNIMSKFNEMGMGIKDTDDGNASEKIKKVIEIVKEKENNGYQYENADASFFLITKKALGSFKPFFSLVCYRLMVEKDSDGNIVSEATVKLDVRGKEEHTVAEGNGPVDALNNCLRKALIKYYPDIKSVFLMDFKVRVVNSDANTAAKVRVLIESSDASKSWGTIGVSENIIDASWQALSDSVEYKLLKSKK
ncbi:(R)-citramalate synthase [Endomicrobiia bacterium]|uniref:citramalate synthase n=1 Tax=Endomicrobium trichonymphae TaxID=1408204 RepID=UPI00086505AD|nr:citramalate synthase [Candidatus Endomicrobium trichonymphae]GHT04780.1 (R)-citramalate synthase [Endomicrobiia bacterium]BAV59271.1 putative (R)-citramalate synthase [Candidatus Endomicrobium trichonymphae]GHT07744.1 (R)-citramalate synthase [Endomicrobiia bacterium]GHT12071.1 (R)-citramalate synthase [Endomicrobiia bacterium]GHT15083.1 (R)-citramalate synthase [Endomicrobiia bacterium]